MLEVMLMCGEEIPEPSLFKRIADIDVVVNYQMAMAKDPHNRIVYFHGGRDNYGYHLDRAELSTQTPLAATRNTLYSTLNKYKNIYHAAGLSGIATYSLVVYKPADNWVRFTTNVSGQNDSFFVTRHITLVKDNYLIKIGGIDSAGAKGRLVVIDLSNNTYYFYSYSNVVANNNPVSGDVINGLCYILLEKGGLYRGTVTTASSSWIQLKACPMEPGFGVRCVAYNDKLYCYGGGLGKKLYCYDPKVNDWSLITTGGPGGDYNGVALDGSVLYVFSGRQVWTVELDETRWDI